MVFQPKHTDYERSPYTGLTRQDWIDAARYLLNGIFQYIDDSSKPVVVPRLDTQITYPHKDEKGNYPDGEIRAEIFEGLTRSLFLAAPLIHEDVNTTIHGINLRDYYKRHILRACTSGDPYCAGSYEEMQELTHSIDPFHCYQQTVETGGLVISLWITKEEIWDTYTKQEKDTIAKFLMSYAVNNTCPQNWRLFCMLALAFLNMVGYEIDEKIMLDHAQAILDYYVGDGWYRDGQCFDYYSCWAFNFYGPIWNVWYGYEHLPWIAAKIEEHSNKLMESYPDFFDRDGFVNMWGRSNIYRMAVISAFDGNFFLHSPAADPGLARRICSGCLMQFLGRDDFLHNGIPNLGFYGQFTPLVQGYSCTESVFWLGKAFLCLHLPAEHPFWTATEALGTWHTLKKQEVKTTVLNGPALCYSNHEANGSTILRTGKVNKNLGDLHGMWNYSKLSYHTKYPWESTPNGKQARFSFGEIESQQYVLKDLTDGTISLANQTLWGGRKEQILYRRQYFDYRTDVETHWLQGIYLADFEVPYGLIRVDKVKLHRRPVCLTLGSYGFPDNGTQIQILEQDGAKAILVKGSDAMGREKQMVMTVWSGWEDLQIVHSTGTNPDSRESIILYGFCQLNTQYDSTEPYVFLSQILTKESHEPFSEDEIFPIQRICFTDEGNVGAYGPIKLEMKNGTHKIVDFEELEGSLSI